MLKGRLAAYRARVRSALEAAFNESHTPHEIGLSFAIGIFITTLPTLGLGYGVFVVLAYFFSWVNKLALIAAAIVLNPATKPFVHAASYQISGFFFSPRTVEPFNIVLLDAAVNIVRRILIGNLIIATVLSIVSYLLVRKLTIGYRARNGGQSNAEHAEAGN
ncbi:DUF2062 domain-containing protein [Halalkalirubrum salinum]|uniref:DUF2062 domain-containing protein n=1 Tax=Halalkalirubrum salinum TaxID=2563889 RepID=UPI0010FB62E7|nr:DUF2062 domain-containing protein [Halalkalirubrum salinum]